MYKNYKILALAAIGFFTACNGKLDKKETVNHYLQTKSDGLKIDTVFVSTEDVQPTENTFIYGQTFYTNFKGIDGFTIEDGNYFPEMELYLLSKSGDTVLQYNRLLGGLGQPQDVPTLNGSLILANPIFSETEYTAKYKLFDIKGTGAFYSEMDFKLIKDPHIQVKEMGLSAKEVYIMNRTKGTVITDGVAPFDTNLSMDFQILSGFKTRNDKIELGMEIQVTDASGEEIAQVKDALADVSYNNFRDDEVIQATLTLRKGRLKNPLTWQVRLWDKNSTAEVTAVATLIAE